MQFDGEEIGGRESGPAQIELLGDQRRGAEYVGQARTMLGNLKQRMSFNALLQGQDFVKIPEKKYIRTLYDLLYSGELQGENVPIEKAKKINIEVIVNGSIAVSSIRGLADIDKITIDIEVEYRRLPMSGVACIGYILQVFSSDSEADGNLLDVHLKNPGGGTLHLRGIVPPPSVFDSSGFMGFPDNNAYYAEAKDDAELQAILSADIHTTHVYDLGGPITLSPTPASSSPANFTYVYGHTTTTGTCGYKEPVGDLIWNEASFWGRTVTVEASADIQDSHGGHSWVLQGSVNVNSPGLIYSGAHFPDAIFGYSCDKYEAVPSGAEYADVVAYKAYIYDSAVVGIYNAAYQASFDSNTATYKNYDGSVYVFTWGSKPYSQGSFGGVRLTRRKDAHGLCLLGGFSYIKLGEFTIQDRSDEAEFGSAAVFMLPDGSTRYQYAYADPIIAATPSKYSVTNDVYVGDVIASEVAGSAVTY